MRISTSDMIIKGITTAGCKFRPSDWAERLSSAMSTFGADNRVSYSPFVRPVTIDGIHCVVVSKKLQEVDPRAYQFVMGFAHDNDLTVLDGAVWVSTQVPGVTAGA